MSVINEVPIKTSAINTQGRRLFSWGPGSTLHSCKFIAKPERVVIEARISQIQRCSLVEVEIKHSHCQKKRTKLRNQIENKTA